MVRGWFRGAAIIGVIAVSLTACSKPNKSGPVVDTVAIAAIVKADAERMTTDFNTKDGAEFIRHDARNVIAMFHGAPNSVGASADLAGTIVGFDAGPANLTLTDMVVDVPASGDFAVLRATYDYHHYDPVSNRSIFEKGNYIAGYRPQADGAWKIAWEVFSDTSSTPGPKP